MGIGTFTTNPQGGGNSLRGEYDVGDAASGFRQQVIAGDVDSFGRLIISEKSTLLELKSVYGFTDFRDEKIETDGATVTNTGTEYRIRSNTTGTANGQLRTQARIRYMPGTDAEVGMGIRTTGDVAAGQVALWGAYNDTDGMGVKLTDTGYKVFVRQSSSDTETAQASWSEDTLDGSGDADNPSGFNLSTTQGLIWQFRFSWYGYSQIFEFYASVPWRDDKQRMTLLHREKIDTSTSTSFPNPNFRARQEVQNNGATTSYDLFTAGRQGAVLGKYTPDFRLTPEPIFGTTVSGSSTLTPLLSLKHKSNSEDISIKLSRISIISDTDLFVGVFLNSTLAGTSYGSLTFRSDSETGLEKDTAGTLSGGNSDLGELIASDVISGGGQGGSTGDSAVDVPNFDIPIGQPVTLAARPADGASTPTVTGQVTIREDW